MNNIHLDENIKEKFVYVQFLLYLYSGNPHK